MEVDEEVGFEVDERRDSLKLRVRLLLARLLRALKVRSEVVVVQLVKLRSRSESAGEWVSSSMKRFAKNMMYEVLRVQMRPAYKGWCCRKTMGLLGGGTKN